MCNGSSKNENGTSLALFLPFWPHALQLLFGLLLTSFLTSFASHHISALGSLFCIKIDVLESSPLKHVLLLYSEQRSCSMVLCPPSAPGWQCWPSSEHSHYRLTWVDHISWFTLVVPVMSFSWGDYKQCPPFHSQKYPSLQDKLYGYPTYISLSLKPNFFFLYPFPLQGCLLISRFLVVSAKRSLLTMPPSW